MLPEDRYFLELTESELWERYCGFLDLSVEEFMEIQEGLLLDEIERVADGTLGKQIMGPRKPRSVDEFRRTVPMTTYDDYEPYLCEKREDVLAVKPAYWCQSAGRSGPIKWLPHSEEFLEVAIKRSLSSMLLASAKKKGQINLSPGCRCLFLLAPPPYASGFVLNSVAGHFSFLPMIDPDKTSGMELTDKIRAGFTESMKNGVDVIGALPSGMVRMGEAMSSQASSIRISGSMLHPKILFRLFLAWLKSKKDKRPILPKDLWPSKAILTGGVDAAIYSDDIAYYWGSNAYEIYVCAETFFLALQGWNKKWLTFLPDTAFLEFIPYDNGSVTGKGNGSRSQPGTVLMDELEEGKLYELVITGFYGMPLMRYRLNDVVKIVALEDGESGVKLPQLVFQRRAGETIDLGGISCLDEKTLWKAITDTGVKYNEWIACEEHYDGRSIARIYLEVKEDTVPEELEKMIDAQLKTIDADYGNVWKDLPFQPIRITLLSPGTFQRCTEELKREGTDLSQINPVHLNPSEEVIKRLVELSEVIENTC